MDELQGKVFIGGVEDNGIKSAISGSANLPACP
jgi:hypothetical protein